MNCVGGAQLETGLQGVIKSARAKTTSLVIMCIKTLLALTLKGWRKQNWWGGSKRFHLLWHYRFTKWQLYLPPPPLSLTSSLPLQLMKSGILPNDGRFSSDIWDRCSSLTLSIIRASSTMTMGQQVFSFFELSNPINSSEPCTLIYQVLIWFQHDVTLQQLWSLKKLVKYLKQKIKSQ